ncbi:MAG: NUDIX domain-containing protein [Clostridia bacterium]|nr:NUDIX domain-containing protein [Clostridia bacterium]
MEHFDIYDENGNPTSERIERSLAHEKGVLHAAVHIYIYRINCGRYEILLQKRADDKDSFPSCYDTSCAGHVSAGDSFEKTALKELSEELGVTVNITSLTHAFDQLVEKINVFHGKTFIDREFNKVYLLNYDAPEDSFTFQKDEISALKWMDADELLYELECKNPDYCIMTDTYKKALSTLKSEGFGKEGFPK